MRASTKNKLSAAADTPATASAAAGPPTAAGPAASPAPQNGAPVIFIALPPADANIPASPKGWVAGPGADYRGDLPRKAELTTLEAAIQDLRRFTDYTEVLGKSAPPIEHVLQLLEAGAAWSSMRASTAAWDVYSQAQEGLSWSAIRGVMTKLRTFVDLAVANDGTLATQLPSLVTLLDAQKVIARKGASTRQANKTEEAAGKPQTHGKVGKARQRAAERAALQSQSGPVTNPAPAAQPAPPAEPTAAAPPAPAPAPKVTANGGTASN